MKILQILTIFILLSGSLKAYELPESCSIKKADCIHCTQTATTISNFESIQKFNNKALTPLKTLKLFTKKADSLMASNTAIKEYLASMFRTLRNKNEEPTYKYGMTEIKKIQDDFDKLTILSKEANIIAKKRDICISTCSAVAKMELNTDLERIQKLKTILLINQPLLANSNFDDHFANMNESFIDSESLYTREEFEAILNKSLFENLAVVLKKQDELYRYADDSSRPEIDINNLNEIHKYNEKLIEKFPLISDSIIQDLSHTEAKIAQPENEVCYLAQKFKSYTTKKEYQELGVDVTLFALPFLLGPVGRASEMSLQLILGQKLANFGLKNAGAVRSYRLPNLAIRTGIIALDFNKIKNKNMKCEEAETSFVIEANKEKYSELQDCRKELSNQLLLTEISLIPLAKSNISKEKITKFFLKNKTTNLEIKPPTSLLKKISLLQKDFGGGKNKAIKQELDNIVKLVKEEKRELDSFNAVIKKKSLDIDSFNSRNNILNDVNAPIPIPASKLVDYEKSIGKDTIEILYVPGALVPHLPKSIQNVGHIAIRVGDKVYHQTGGSGFKVETLDNFINVTKKDFKVFGQVLETSDKEMKVMKSYFEKINSKQLPYSFLVNNCSHSVCRSLSLADIEKTNAVTKLDPYLAQLKMKRNERVVMKTSYNSDKDISEKELLSATVRNRLAFYGVPLTVAAGAATGVAEVGYQSVDFIIEYLNQIKEEK